MVKLKRCIFRGNNDLTYNLKQKMSDKPPSAEERLKGLPVTAETPGFKPEEMSVCEKCARPNPPTRAKCFYCGEPLKIAEGREDLVAPNLRPMEAWEKGFNIIFNGNAFPSENIRAAATLLRREPDEIKSIFEKQRPLPLAQGGISTRSRVDPAKAGRRRDRLIYLAR